MCLHSRRKIGKENASRSSTTDLPLGIVEDILSRLPVKTLLICRCVSKSWRSLIGSEHFIKIHLQNSTENTSLSHPRLIFNLVHHSQRLLMHCSWHSLLNEQAVDSFAFKGVSNIQWNSIKLVGCCNGLVCFLLYGRYFFLWNPSTRMYKKLPDADDNLCGKIISKYGFGFDESNNDYKVLVIMFCYTNTPNQVIRRVFSLKTNSWKTLEYEDDSSQHFGGAGKFASGNLHWNMLVGSCVWEIISFNLTCEAFERVELPNYSKGPDCQTLGLIDGCLSVLCVYTRSHSDIWVMKQYGVRESWVKVATLPQVPGYCGLNIISRLFCKSPNGEIVLFYNSGFLIYHPEHNLYRYGRLPNIGSLGDADLYVESLVSLGSDAERTLDSNNLQD